MNNKQDITTTGMPLIDSVVERLCHESSLSAVWHRSGQGAPMPSLTVLSEILERLRAAIFPGYFGAATVRRESMRYHMSANLDSIQIRRPFPVALLVFLFRSGLCAIRTQWCRTSLDRFTHVKPPTTRHHHAAPRC